MNQILELQIDTEEKLKSVIDLIFEKVNNVFMWVERSIIHLCSLVYTPDPGIQRLPMTDFCSARQKGRNLQQSLQIAIFVSCI
jgi:hypothetical protein